IRVIDPEITEIGDPRDVVSPGEPAGDNKPGIRRRAGENDLGLPCFNQLPAGGNGGSDPVGANIRNMDQRQIVPAKSLPKRSRRSVIFLIRVLTTISLREGCAAAQQSRDPFGPVLALTVLGIT